MSRQERWVLFRDLPRRILPATKVREHLGVYLLASLSNAFLASSQYLAVSSAVASYLPVDSGTATLIAAYGPGLGIFLAVFLKWISTLQNNRVDSSNAYASLFWFGLASTIFYLAMILVLRKSYGNLTEQIGRQG